MSDLPSSLTALISSILRRFLGADIDRSVFGPVAWSDLGAMACIILFMLLLHGTAAALVRHKTRQARAEAKELKDHFFGARGRPLYLIRYDIMVADNLQARKIYTQIHVLSKTLYVLLGLFTLTYVVIHIWDDRRLVVPLSYFIEKPFQNWTRASAQLLGSVFFWVDYTLPVEDARKALKVIVEGNPLWDKRFWNLQVTDATEKTMQLRVLATAADSSKSWDLRCAIREQFIAYLRKNHPQSLPHLRANLGNQLPAQS